GEKEKCLAAGMDDVRTKSLRQAELLVALQNNIYRKDDDRGSNGDAELYLDMNHLEQQVGDDEEFRNMFLNLVVQETEASGLALKEACMQDDRGAIKKILHKLKGTAGTAGLFSLAETAAMWENRIDRSPDLTALEKEIAAGIATGLELIKKLIK